MNNPEYAFWNDYTITLQKLAIPEAKINCYVMWVKRFEKFLCGVLLLDSHLEAQVFQHPADAVSLLC
jgi:hypothetical protein